MHVREIMSADLVSCGPDTPLREVARLMAEHDCGPIPIVSAADRRQPMGVVTDRDIACRVVAKGRNPLDLTAKDCMSSPVVTIAQDAPVEDCCRLMEQHQVRRVLVIDERSAVCGIVSQADIARVTPEKTAGHVVKAVSQQTPTASR
ncbi:MAG TPA: CBS domain-containing protein [Vicinamibacterales bacterium]|nr:CBS domain-containing protein [Vicinamibacterales bacterium]